MSLRSIHLSYILMRHTLKPAYYILLFIIVSVLINVHGKFAKFISLALLLE